MWKYRKWYLVLSTKTSIGFKKENESHTKPLQRDFAWLKAQWIFQEFQQRCQYFPQLYAVYLFLSWKAVSLCFCCSHHNFLEPALEGIKILIVHCPFCNGCTLRLEKGKYGFQTLRKKNHFGNVISSESYIYLNECIKHLN